MALMRVCSISPKVAICTNGSQTRMTANNLLRTSYNATYPSPTNNRDCQHVFERESLDKVNNAALSLPGITTVQTWGDSDSGVGIVDSGVGIGVGIICSSFWWSRNRSRNRGDWNRNRSGNRGDWNRSWNRNQMTIPHMYVHVPSNIHSGNNPQET